MINALLFQPPRPQLKERLQELLWMGKRNAQGHLAR
jgi:hypothetical protein